MLDPAWAGLIDRAWVERSQVASGWHVGSLPPNPDDFESTLQFVAVCLAASPPYAAALEAHSLLPGAQPSGPSVYPLIRCPIR